VAFTCTIVQMYVFTGITWVRPVGSKYVRGGYRTSASVGNAEIHCRSAPRCRLCLVTMLKMRDCPLFPMLYSAAVVKSVVVDIGASCTHAQTW
jgi:hypothetical protein